ncbi:MAG: energy transducer TonB, partial [Magnetococcales bacterium]|nr:energy transducer TonB [Magnetococcales bacterium]
VNKPTATRADPSPPPPREPRAPATPAQPAPLPSLSLNPSLGEMARWDRERQQREQQEVFKRQEETVNLNTRQVRYAAYFSRLKERIQMGWIYPEEAKKAKLDGALTMSFTILRNGSVTDFKILKSSGAEMLDEAAMRAVRNVHPFVPFPEDWDLEKLHVKTTFEYIRGGGFRWGL